MEAPWFLLSNIDEIDSPALVVYKDRIAENIHRLVHSIDDVSRLRPHVKTHKSGEVTTMMLKAGIHKFKCATIAEAEMLATSSAPDVLLAYQPVGPKAKRLADLMLSFPETHFSCLIDNFETANKTAEVFLQRDLSIDVYIDLNVGMNRTGILPEHAETLWNQLQLVPGIDVVGLHVYDGHLRDPDFELRRKKSDDAFNTVIALQNKINSKAKTTIIAGGTPTYSIHSKRKNIECSPGTFIYWDKGYEQLLPEQHYLHAAVVVTRIISKPTEDTICIDLGHKSIASENPLSQRIYFLNAEGLEPTGHSEEHMTLKTNGLNTFNVGDILYGIPYHVCPTVALHDRTAVAESHKVISFWNTLSRNRYISI